MCFNSYRLQWWFCLRKQQKYFYLFLNGKRFKRSFSILRYAPMKIRHYAVCKLNIKVHSTQEWGHSHSYLHHNVSFHFYKRCFSKTYLNKIPIPTPFQMEQREIDVYVIAFRSLDHPCTCEISFVIKKRYCPILLGVSAPTWLDWK